jgi:hypothetical protein
MGFAFGYVSQIDAEVALGSFFMMIVFLVGFDHLTGVLEWSLEDVPIYNHMLQHIYKEIMIMGVVSFCIGMYQTTDEAQQADDQEWIIGVDFAHYILFYMAFFFVMHAFYLIFLAMSTAKAFDRYHAMEIADVRDLVPPNYGWFNTFLFNYSPVSKIREKFEFKITYVLFRDTYKWVSLDFDFAHYLTGCMQHYALKVMCAGSFSWLVIMVLIVLNYARIKLAGDGFLNCGPHKFVTSDTPSYYNATDVHAYEDHRLLSAAGAASPEVSEYCNRLALRAYFFCGFILCSVTILVLVISRMYLSRLIQITGCDSAEDYSNFLAIEEESLKEERRELKRRQCSAALLSETQGECRTPTADESNSFRMAEIKQKRLSGTSAGTSAGKGRARRMSIGSAVRSVNALKDKSMSEEDEMYERLAHCVSSCVHGIRHGCERMWDWCEECWMYLCYRAAYERKMEKLRALAGSPTTGGGSLNSIFKKRVTPTPPMERAPAAMDRDCKGDDAAVVAMETQRQTDMASPPPAGVGDTGAGAGTGIGAGRVRKSVFKPRMTVTGGIMASAHEQGTSTINKFRLQKMQSGRLLRATSSKRPAHAVAPRGPRPGQGQGQGSGPGRAGHGGRAAAKEAGEEDGDINSSRDFSDIYLWNSPKIFFTSIEILFSLNCFYLAMWVTNFITIVNSATENKVIWQIFMLFPVVLIMPCLGQIVKTASLLSAISDLDLNVMASVFEDQQAKMALLKLLKERIQERIDETDVSNNTPELVVANMFAEIDTDDSGELSKKEFSMLFTMLDLNYSDDKFNHLYKTIDVNKDGSISKKELCHMVFPELDADAVEDASSSMKSNSGSGALSRNVKVRSAT